MALTFGSLFAGIGGFDLGFERSGMSCRWQVEIDERCRRVLAKHWPNVERFEDVRTFAHEDYDRLRVDVICGGFPCQDISVSGKGAGLGGDRSGLWSEYARIIRVLRPRFVVVENSPAITFRGLGVVLGDLAGLGYDAEWEVLSACMFGSPHMRRRMFIVANANGRDDGAPRPHQTKARPESVFDGRPRTEGSVAGWWAANAEPCSVAHGVPGLVDRLRGYGNAVVPQVAEYIGRRVVAMAG